MSGTQQGGKGAGTGRSEIPRPPSQPDQPLHDPTPGPGPGPTPGEPHQPIPAHDPPVHPEHDREKAPDPAPDQVVFDENKEAR